jgi:glutathione S-transferase
MLTVHHLAKSQSERIVWLCEELELPYDFVRYEREATGQAPADYRALSDFHTAPVITDGDLTLGESGAIVEYILRKHGGERLTAGPDDADFVDYLFWFHFANGSFVPGLMMDHFQQPTTIANFESRSARAARMIEARLGKVPFFAGDRFTAADIMMSLPRFYAGQDLADRPNTRAYLQQLYKRPALLRALDLAEPEQAPPSFV